ncbi:hypothetical protein NL676_031967 [Syzygium grande]|nr:hypothetical protein NL676_031967 [Syzygium grande]
MVVKIIIEMVRMKLTGSNDGIGSLIEDLEEPLESTELRMNIIAEPRHTKAKAVEAIEAFRQSIEEGRLQGWELDSCGDCWVSEGCLVDSNETPAAIDAQINVPGKGFGRGKWAIRLGTPPAEYSQSEYCCQYAIDSARRLSVDGCSS